ncbi:MAG: hypothetical protein FWC42_11445, partial [Proteobacteria bacterium]|nr:hypothetical protein [Pseudomonadota bacterium]
MKTTSRIVSIVLAFFLALIFSASAASASGAVANSSSATVIDYSPSNGHSLAAAADTKVTVTPDNASGKIIKAQESIASKGFYDGYTEPITFSEFPAYTRISNQYQSRGIIFSTYFSKYYPYIIFPDVYPIYLADNTYDPGLFCVYTDTFGYDEGCIMSGVFVSPKDPTKKIGAKAIDLWIGYLAPYTANTATLHLYDKSGKQIYETIIDLPPLSKHRENIQSDQEFYFWKITTKNYFVIDNLSVKLAEADVSATIKLEAEAATSPGASNEPVTGKDITVTVNLKDSQGNAVTYPFTECKWSNIPDPATKQLTSKNGDPANQCKLTFQYLDEGGMSWVTYGPKVVSFSGKIDTDSGEQTVTAFHAFKVFFDKTAPYKGYPTPNWFIYWDLDGAVAGLNTSNTIFKDMGPYTVAQVNTKTKLISIGPSAAETQNVFSFPKSAECPGIYIPAAKGIDVAARTLAHEKRHQDHYDYQHIPGIWVGKPDSDGDGLPDEYEDSIGTSNLFKDSCGLSFIAEEYAYYGDQEFDARMVENFVKGVAANDWANPGAQTTPAFKSLSIAPKAEGPSY